MLGFLLVLLGSLCLATQNMLLRVVFVTRPILGQFMFGGFIAPTVGHSLLILQMRTLFILPLVLASAPLLYPSTWNDLRQLLTAHRRMLCLSTIGSSSFLFLSLALLFVAIAHIPAGIAVSLFFVHPALTVLLSWQILGNRPTLLRLAVLALVFTGSYLIAPVFAKSLETETLIGIGAALGAGIAYSIQSIWSQICLRQMHPVPFTVVNFVVNLILSSFSLLWIKINVASDSWGILLIISFATAALTLAGQLFYNFGIRLGDAVVVSITAISNPSFTALLAWLILQELLQGRQMLGIGLVLLGIMALSWEK